MIDYGELVSALHAWRARQGLPVSGGVITAPVRASGSGPRTAPPGPPPASRPIAARPPSEVGAGAEELLGDDALEEESTEFGTPPPGPRTAPGAVASAPAAVTATDDDQGGLVEPIAMAQFGEPTALGVGAYPARGQQSNTIDIDSAPTSFGEPDEES